MKRNAVLIAVAVVSLGASLARADAVPPPVCDSTCQGCCQASVCVPSTASNCGAGGAVCVACQSGQSCIAGVCKASSADGGTVTPKEKESGCAIGWRGGELAGFVGPWLLCLSLFAGSILLLARRRRRR